ncbi:DUF4097 family beta strand repeat-containing protein [Micromonospora sp. HM5-17]|jgi:hypothetical protein|uniref:DUF4097 family beta strand repeat-containing protein n=1 Tax=Micromonospora sp. HM5-17 TaxID=2487710 RepID=UPI000F4A66C7|nr:DUF4097 family beta strand repeat-containing protein [Micromonospora sp. HM5-17]ROT32270.1 hypothetical protein EF879_11830 [Micromonospora sp. HM5-17]
MTSWTVAGSDRLTITEPVDRVVVRLDYARLNVVGTEGPARIEISRPGRRPVLVEYRSGTLSVRQRGRWSWMELVRLVRRRVGPEVSIGVPPGTEVDLQLVTGTLLASGLTGSTRAEITSGQITLMGLRGRTSVKLVSGPVEALGVAGDLTMETVSGELILAEGTAERIQARTVSGAITCDLDNPGESEIDLATISGSVTVRVRRDSDLDVRLHATSGTITSDFPELTVDGLRSWVGKRAQGILGTGRGRLAVTAQSGSITLLARATAE